MIGLLRRAWERWRHPKRYVEVGIPPRLIEPLPINEEYEREIIERGRRLAVAFEQSLVYDAMPEESIIEQMKRSMESGEAAALTVADLERLYRDEIDPEETP